MEEQKKSPGNDNDEALKFETLYDRRRKRQREIERRRILAIALTVTIISFGAAIAAAALRANSFDLSIVEFIQMNSTTALNIGVAVLSGGAAAIILLTRVQNSKFGREVFNGFFGLSTDAIRSRGSIDERAYSSLREQQQILEDKITEMQNIEQKSVNSVALEDFLNDAMRRRVIKQADASALQHYRESVSTKRQLDMSLAVFESILSKLEIERKTLSIRTASNVIVGIVIAVVGIFLLSTIITATESQDFNTQKSFLTLGLRFSTVIFVSVFSLFFLNLYRAGLADMKYYVNEFTNVSGMYMGTKLAIHLNDKTMLKEVAIKLMSTERNFVLKKGERTVSGEQSENEKIMLESLFANLKLFSGQRIIELKSENVPSNTSQRRSQIFRKK